MTTKNEKGERCQFGASLAYIGRGAVCGEVESRHCHAGDPPETYHRKNVEDGTSGCTSIHSHRFVPPSTPEPTRDRRCGSQGLDADGHCIRCGLKPDEDVINDQPECPPGFLAPQSPAGEQAGEGARAREFTNELGNRIRITIEGPTSLSENVLTPMEASVLRDLLPAASHECNGPNLGVVASALGTWNCRLNVDAVDCAHSYCREHELVNRLSRLRSLASEEGLRLLAARIQYEMHPKERNPIVINEQTRTVLAVLTEHFEEKK